MPRIVLDLTVIDVGDGTEDELDVGRRQIGLRLEERGRLTHVGREHAAAAGQVVEQLGGLLGVHQGDRVPRRHDQRDHQVILEIRADPGGSPP